MQLSGKHHLCRAVAAPLLLTVWVAMFVEPARCAQAQNTATRETTIEKLEAALGGLPEIAESVKLSVGRLDVPQGGHLQGIQLRRDERRQQDVVFLSHDSQSVAYLVVGEFPLGLAGEGHVTHVHNFPSDGQTPPLRHAGGFQIADNVLAIGLEDNQLKTRSQVQFWNIADAAKPRQLEHLTIRRRGEPKEQTAGAVALAARAKDHLLAVANWDSRAIDLYVSNGKPLADDTCRFTHLAQWRADAADTDTWRPDKQFGTYQAINFVTGGDDNLYLLAFNTEPAGADVVELFAVAIAEKPQRFVRKLARRAFKLTGGSHFRFARGAAIADGRLTILASPSQLTDETQLSVAR